MGKEDRGGEWVEYACHHGQISRLMSSVVPSLIFFFCHWMTARIDEAWRGRPPMRQHGRTA